MIDIVFFAPVVKTTTRAGVNMMIAETGYADIQRSQVFDKSLYPAGGLFGRKFNTPAAWSAGISQMIVFGNKFE